MSFRHSDIATNRVCTVLIRMGVSPSASGFDLETAVHFLMTSFLELTLTVYQTPLSRALTVSSILTSVRCEC